MNRYKLPTCECGVLLIIYEENGYATERKITKNGSISKKAIETYHVHHGCTVLVCPKCKKRYDYEHDDKNRIIRDKED